MWQHCLRDHVLSGISYKIQWTADDNDRYTVNYLMLKNLTIVGKNQLFPFPAHSVELRTAEISTNSSRMANTF